MASDQHVRRSSRRWTSWLQNALTTALIALAVTLIWLLISGSRDGAKYREALLASARPPQRPQRPPPPPLPTEPVALGGAAVLGRRDAPLTVIAYSDVECPYCGTFARDTMPEWRKRYIETGKARFSFRHLPLDQIHPLARQAAEALECAGQQGKLWDLHDRLFETPKQVDAVAIARHATSVALDTTRFGKCLSDGAGAARVNEDVASARSLGVTGTPTFFVGSTLPDGRVKLLQRLSGALPLPAWDSVVEKWLVEAKANPKAGQ